ncbi:hypothetical protein ACROYT_G016381 [Oculina patagonica]
MESESDWSLFKQAKNKVTNLIRNTKQSYFKDKFSEHENNTRKLWNLIKCLSKDDEEKQIGIKNLTENDEIISDKNSIAEILNNFFIDQPKKLTTTLDGESLSDSLSSIKRGSACEFDIPPITQKETAELLLSIPAHKATGDDGISAKLLKIAAPAIVPSLAKLLNHCLRTKTFPSAWKVARVTPVFKGNGNRNDKNNYRPISVLPVLSKLLEKHVCDHLCKFLNENGLLHSFQSGFRKRFSTETALIRLVDQILFDLDSDKVTGIVFVDYKKAFDLIDHQLLLTKLGAIGVGEDYLPLFTDYMNGRKQYVNIDGCHSSIRDITLGVPQGSILGPVLFLIFINDLPSALQDTVADIYADDTTVSYSTDYRLAPWAVSDSLQSDLNKLQKWSDNNKMILNEKKTKTMLATGTSFYPQVVTVVATKELSHTLAEEDALNVSAVALNEYKPFPFPTLDGSQANIFLELQFVISITEVVRVKATPSGDGNFLGTGSITIDDKTATPSEVFTGGNDSVTVTKRQDTGEEDGSSKSRDSLKSRKRFRKLLRRIHGAPKPHLGSKGGK